jgi:sodium/bile acid cotransporter 7
VALTVVAFLPESAGEEGLLVIPCVVAHIAQLFIDSYIASYWASKTTDENGSSKEEEVRWIVLNIEGEG